MANAPPRAGCSPIKARAAHSHPWSGSVRDPLAVLEMFREHSCTFLIPLFALRRFSLLVTLALAVEYLTTIQPFLPLLALFPLLPLSLTRLRCRTTPELTPRRLTANRVWLFSQRLVKPVILIAAGCSQNGTKEESNTGIN